MVEKLNPDNDTIKTIYTDKEGRMESVIFSDGNSLKFNEFITLFKRYLMTIIAGEVISWDDIWRFNKQTDAKGMEDMLANVELEGTLKGARFSLTRSQKMSLGALIIIIMIIALAFVMFGSVINK